MTASKDSFKLIWKTTLINGEIIQDKNSLIILDAIGILQIEQIL